MSEIPLKAVITNIADRCDEFGSQKAYAAHLGCSTSYLNDVLKGKRRPSDAMLKNIGLERATIYRRKT